MIKQSHVQNSCFLSYVLMVCFAAFSLSAQDYYVSASLGNDSNSGTENAPFATINKWIAEVSAGGTVFVMKGNIETKAQVRQLFHFMRILLVLLTQLAIPMCIIPVQI